MRLTHCPNCRREFSPTARHDEYCPECWRAWCRADGSFALRRKDPIKLGILDRRAALKGGEA